MFRWMGLSRNHNRAHASNSTHKFSNCSQVDFISKCVYFNLPIYLLIFPCVIKFWVRYFVSCSLAKPYQFYPETRSEWPMLIHFQPGGVPRPLQLESPCLDSLNHISTPSSIWPFCYTTEPLMPLWVKIPISFFSVGEAILIHRLRK